jgi:hypothetical protein
MEVGCVIFGMTQKKTKRYARDNGLEGWNEDYFYFFLS